MVIPKRPNPLFLLAFSLLAFSLFPRSSAFAASCTFSDTSTGKSYSGECRANTPGCNSGELSKDDSSGACSTSGGVGIWDCCVPNTTTFYCGTGGEGTCKDTCASSDTAVSGSDSQCASLTITKGKCCKAASTTTGTTCSGKDSSGTTQSGTCSSASSCSSGTALSSATGCSTGLACCYNTASSTATTCSGKDSSSTTQSGTCSTTSTCSSGTALSSTTGCSSGLACCYSSTSTSTSSAKCTGSNAGFVPCGRSCDNPATTDVDESAVCTLCHLFLLIRNITNWIFSVMTYIAFAVLVAMGIFYIVSAGNTQMTNIAKGGIKSALYGFAMVLLAWVAVNVVMMVLADGSLGSGTATFSFKTNGSWFTYNCSTTSKYVRTGVTGASSSGSSGSGGGSGTLTCSGCSAISDAVKNNGIIDPNLLFVMLNTGEGCNNGKAGDFSSTGSCGYGQVTAYNRARYCPGMSGTESDCTLMKNNVTADVTCAALFIQKSLSSCFPFSSAKIEPPDKSTILATPGSAGYIGGCYNCGPGKRGTCCGTNNYCVRIQTAYNSCQ